MQEPILKTSRHQKSKTDALVADAVSGSNALKLDTPVKVQQEETKRANRNNGTGYKQNTKKTVNPKVKKHKQTNNGKKELEKWRKKQAKKKAKAIKKQKELDAFFNSEVVLKPLKKPKYGPASLAFLGAICMLCVLLCMQYIHGKNILTTKTLEVAKMERELSDLKSENDAYHRKVLASVTIDDIYDYATDELGLHFPSEKQVRYYNSENESYVRQYTDVPK